MRPDVTEGVPNARTLPFGRGSARDVRPGVTEGVLNARTGRVCSWDLRGQGIPSARTLLPDGFDLMSDLWNRRLGRKEYQAAEHRLDSGIGVDGED